jgi:hypothetical protein
MPEETGMKEGGKISPVDGNPRTDDGFILALEAL